MLISLPESVTARLNFLTSSAGSEHVDPARSHAAEGSLFFLGLLQVADPRADLRDPDLGDDEDVLAEARG